MNAPAPSRKLLKMRVKKIVDHTKMIRELFIENIEPAEFTFRAGQFVMLHVPQADKPALRAYSVASDDRVKNGFRLVFKYVENGVASKFVWALKENAELNFTGPFGRVFFQEPPTEQVIFMNTGSGISQHTSYLFSKAHLYPLVHYRLLFGLRDESDIFYRAELDSLKKVLPHFSYDFVLSRPSDSWKGRTGYIQGHLEELGYLKLPTTFYLCGNGNMIKDTKHRLIEQQGFDPKRIFAEAFD